MFISKNNIEKNILEIFVAMLVALLISAPSIMMAIEKFTRSTVVDIDIKLIIIISSTVFMLIFLLIAQAYMIKDIIRKLHKRRFKKDMIETVVTNKLLTWQDVKEMADTKFLTSNELRHIIKEIHYKFVTTETINTESKNLIKEYIKNCNLEKPLEYLPEEIQVSVKSIRDRVGKDDHALNDLIMQIQNLLDNNNSQIKKQRLYTSIGLIVGIISLTMTGYNWL